MPGRSSATPPQRPPSSDTACMYGVRPTARGCSPMTRSPPTSTIGARSWASGSSADLTGIVPDAARAGSCGAKARAFAIRGGFLADERRRQRQHGRYLRRPGRWPHRGVRGAGRRHRCLAVHRRREDMRRCAGRSVPPPRRGDRDRWGRRTSHARRGFAGEGALGTAGCHHRRGQPGPGGEREGRNYRVEADQPGACDGRD